MILMVTGAAGHIGSHLIRTLPNSLNVKKIILVDNMISNRYCSFFCLPEKTKYKFLQFDLAKDDYEALPKSDIVLHFAAKTDAAQSSKYEDEFYSNNLESTKNIINYCNKYNSKFIFASTTSIYGPQSELVDENCSESDLNPQSPYADVKMIEEKLISENQNFTDKNFIILRLGTIYGFSPGIRFHTAVNKFCFQASIKKPLTVWKTAFLQKRPYLSLDDLSNAIIHIINKNLFSNCIYNLVSKNCTVKEIIDIIKKYSRNISIEFVDHEIMNQLSYEISNKKFLDTGFIFNSNIDTEIKKTLNNLF